MKQGTKEPASHINSPKFLEFLSQKFDLTARNATAEEFAEFAFGSMEAAIKAFEGNKRVRQK